MWTIPGQNCLLADCLLLMESELRHRSQTQT